MYIRNEGNKEIVTAHKMGDFIDSISEESLVAKEEEMNEKKSIVWHLKYRHLNEITLKSLVWKDTR